jgi:hypothetical protein
VAIRAMLFELQQSMAPLRHAIRLMETSAGADGMDLAQNFNAR